MSSRRAAAQPDVSIVIPVFNKLELTKVCLASLYNTPVGRSFELIVVDNGSTDGSGSWLAEQEARGHLRLLSNPDNRGFAQGCNLGAAAARGRYTLFLNNDVEVLPGWLEPLVMCFERDPEVGIAGACLMYADQTIQHGGVALVADHNTSPPTIGGIHINHRQPVTAPGARTNSYMQVVTGACLLIRPKVFAEVGGFDETYWNGNEDVDLCLKVGELGHHVVYVGESLIYHYESQSGAERWSGVQANVEHFNEVWRGRAKADYSQMGNSLRATGEGRIRPYAPAQSCQA